MAAGRVLYKRNPMYNILHIHFYFSVGLCHWPFSSLPCSQLHFQLSSALDFESTAVAKGSLGMGWSFSANFRGWGALRMKAVTPGTSCATHCWGSPCTGPPWRLMWLGHCYLQLFRKTEKRKGVLQYLNTEVTIPSMMHILSLPSGMISVATLVSRHNANIWQAKEWFVV